MVVPCSLVNCLWVLVTNDANRRALEILSTERNQFCVLQTTIEIIHQFNSVLWRQTVTEVDEGIRSVSITESVTWRNKLSVTVNSATCTSESTIYEVIEVTHTSIDLLVDAITLAFSFTEEIVG